MSMHLIAAPTPHINKREKKRCMCKVISIKLLGHYDKRKDNCFGTWTVGLMETGNGYTSFNQPRFTMNLF